MIGIIVIFSLLILLIVVIRLDDSYFTLKKNKINPSLDIVEDDVKEVNTKQLNNLPQLNIIEKSIESQEIITIPDGCKLCADCYEIKPIEDFAKKGKNKKGEQLYFNLCKSCKKIKLQAWKEKNPLKVKNHSKKYRNSVKGKETDRKFRKEYYKRESVKQRIREYSRSPKVLERRKKKETEIKLMFRNNFQGIDIDKKTQIIYERLENRLHNRIKESIKHHKFFSYFEFGFGNDNYVDKKVLRHYLGCQRFELVNHFEAYFGFNKSYNWENFDKWHIDHIIPLSSAKTREEFWILNHYSNLQPLMSHINIEKGGDYILSRKEEYIRNYKKNYNIKIFKYDKT